MDEAKTGKWYFRTYVFVIAFLIIGPFALPLVWFNPRFSRKNKAIITVIVLIATYLLSIAMAKSIKTIMEYYQLMSK
jgi:hypothetical protein